MTTFGYLRVSTNEQARSGLGLDAQRARIERAHDVDVWVEDAGVSGGVPPEDRPSLGPVLAGLHDGDVLVVAKLDRIARSTYHFAALMERARDAGWSLVALDLGVDTSTATGRFVADVMAAVAALERELISERTRDALAVAKTRGVVPGPKRALPDEVASRVRRLARRHGPTATARRLNDEGVPTPSGQGRWYPGTVTRYATS